MKKLEKKEKRLYLNYDYAKTWLITCLGLLITTIIGYWTIENNIAKISLNIFMIVLTIAVVLFSVHIFKLFKKLNIFYK